jgi:hypothetical protein
MISEKQLKMIWGLAHRVGLDDDELHEAVKGLTGKASLKQLTNEDVSCIIRRLTNAGAGIKQKRKARQDFPINVVEIITPKQRGLIKYFEEKLGWQDNPARLAGLSRRIIKKEMPVTKKEGIKMILVMRQMVKEKSIHMPIQGCQKSAETNEGGGKCEKATNR